MFFLPIEGTKRRYGTEKTGYRYKVTVARGGRGVRDPDDPPAGGDSEGKLAAALCRARAAVYELGRCNDWDWFCTFTLDRAKYDRYDLDRWRGDFAQFIRNQRRLAGADIRYLLIPERHQDGAWHMHGFMAGIPADDLSRFDPARHPVKLCQGDFWNWQKVSERFGFCSLGRLRSAEAAAGYVTKYISKGLASRAGDVGEHLYFCSRGLHRAEIVFRGPMACPQILRWRPDFENEWCQMWWSESREQFPEVPTSEGGGVCGA